ncbi:MAG: sodium:proton antiporter [Aquificae bacterium]|nr:sodium:proton antiporter [Aquificota bacterium]
MLEKLLSEPLFELGVILLTGYIFGNVANALKLPRVSGYILAGILISPSLLGIIDEEFLQKAHLITHASLSVITFMIGASLSWKRIKSLGKVIALVTLGEAQMAFLVVSTVMFIYLYLVAGISAPVSLALALLFGALASPTDPTATLEVIHEYKARGTLTTTVLGVTALDDATGIMNFVLGYSLALALLGGESPSPPQVAYQVVYQILGAVMLGASGGFLLHLLGRFAKERKEIVTVTVGILFLTFSLAHVLGFDELLATMSVGIALINISEENERFREPLENYIEDILFTAFFVVGASFLNLKVLFEYFPVVLLYVSSRFAGKYIGVWLGGHLSGAPSVVKKYLAFTLFPQGGIVIGLSLLVYQRPELKDYGLMLVNVIIGATVIHEFLGPAFAKFALKRAGEIKED